MTTEQVQKKTQIEVISILDMSGSMYGLRDDTIGGYNQYIDTVRKQKNENNEIYVTLIVFNTNVKFIYRRELIKDVKSIDQTTYDPNGCTALNDAIGRGIEYIDEVISVQKSADKEIRVAMYIQTDGMENSSRNYNKNQIKEMITERQEKGWDVVFAACNIDSFATGTSYGIKANNIAQINNDRAAQHAVYEGLGKRFSYAMAMPSISMKSCNYSMQSAYDRAYSKAVNGNVNNNYNDKQSVNLTNVQNNIQNSHQDDNQNSNQNNKQDEWF